MSDLFQELKRRKVFKVGGAYAIVAWILIQVSGEVLPTFNAPEWVQQTLTFLFFLGFPITLIMAWAYEVTPEGIKADDGTAVPTTAGNSTDRKLIYVVLGFVTLLGGLQITDRFASEPQLNTVSSASSANATVSPTSNLSRRAFINLGITTPIPGPQTNAIIDLSADGSRLLFTVQRPDEQKQSYIQELDQLEARLVPVENVANSAFFSPDGEWIVFEAGQGLSKVSIRGGAPQVLTESYRSGTGGFWSADDTLYYTSNQDGNPLMRIAANGGVPDLVAAVGDGSGEIIYSWPFLLPDGDSLMVTTAPNSALRDGRIELLIQSTGEIKTLIQNGYNARYVPTGHIVFIRAATLWAVPFDIDRLETTGPEVPVIQGVQADSVRGPAVYDFSDDGLLVYLPGEDTKANETLRTLVWVDRNGNEETLPLQRDFRVPVVSPDGQRLAMGVYSNDNFDIWTYDIARNSLSRLSFAEEIDTNPLWSPDGERIVFYSARDGGGLWWRTADGTGQVELLLTGLPNYATPTSFTADGTQLLYDFNDDIYLLNLDGDTATRPLLQTEFDEQRAVLSPDGHWLAYESDETGNFEIYVRPFPDVDAGKWQISNEGGRWPRWHPNGRELFFRRPDNFRRSVWAVQVETDDNFQFETPVRIFSGDYSPVGGRGAFDIAADGSRFLMMEGFLGTSEGSDQTQLVLVDNWFAELRRLAPPSEQ